MLKLALEKELTEFSANPTDAVEGGLIVAQIIDRNAKVDWFRQELDRLAFEIGPGSAIHIVDCLKDKGFTGAKDNYYSLDNSRLDLVMRTKQGIPITLALVVMGVSQKCEIDVQGINFPRHFMLRIGDQFVDPFAMRIASNEELSKWLTENGVDARSAFQVATPSQIVNRMLNNIRMLFQQNREYVRALEISDYQLMLLPENYVIYLERAEIWGKLGDSDMVVGELRKALEFSPDRDFSKRVEERLVMLEGLGSQSDLN